MVVQQNRKSPSTVLTAHNSTGNRTFMCSSRISLVPYAMARMTRERRGHRPLGQSHLGGAVIYCSILAVAPTGICVCFRRYYQAVTNQLTYDKDPDIRQTSWPKAAVTKLPTGSTRQSEGEFSTLLEGPRIGPRLILLRFLREHNDLANSIAKVLCFSHTWFLHCPSLEMSIIAVSRVIRQHWQWQSVGQGPYNDVKFCFHTSNLTELPKI